MIYGSLGNNTAGLNYKKDPLADTIAPDYKKLSMSAWGMPDLDSMDKFAPKMDENLDTVPQEFNEYVSGLNNVTQTVQKFMKLGIDLTKPSLDPQENAAHLELMQQYNDVLSLGKKLQQSRKYADTLNSMAGKQGVWTNPRDENQMITSLNDYVYSPDDKAFDDAIKYKAEHARLLYDEGQVDQANKETEDIKSRLQAKINETPEKFREQMKNKANDFISILPQAMQDAYKVDKIDLEKQGLVLKEKAINNTDAYHRGLLDMARKTFGWKQSQSAPIEFETENLIRKASTGDVQAIDLINRYYGTNTKGELNGASLHVISGSDLKNGVDINDNTISATELKQPDGTIIKVNDGNKYFIRIDENGNRHITPVNETSIKSFTQGVIGKATEAGTQKNKTSNLWSEDETEISDTPINAKKTNNKSGNGSIIEKKRNTDFRKKYNY